MGDAWMTKYPTMLPREDGWSGWQRPLHGHGDRNYRMACCDCCLIHEMQFRVKRREDGRLDVVFRVRRNNRATAALRRHRRVRVKSEKHKEF